MTATITFSGNGFEASITGETLAGVYAEYAAFIGGLSSTNDSFVMTEMVASMHEGKTYWKAKGAPPFHKYGLTVWDEVFEAAGYLLSSLPLSVGSYTPPTGTIAEFVRKDDGKPSKVSKIIFPVGSPELAEIKPDFFDALVAETGIEIGKLVKILKSGGFSTYSKAAQAAMASTVRQAKRR